MFFVLLHPVRGSPLCCDENGRVAQGMKSEVSLVVAICLWEL